MFKFYQLSRNYSCIMHLADSAKYAGYITGIVVIFRPLKLSQANKILHTKSIWNKHIKIKIDD